MKIFVYKEFDQNSGNWKYPHLNFVQYLETGVELGIPNFAWVSLIKNYLILQNSTVLIIMEPFKSSDNLTKFGCHRHCISDDVMVLVYHMILQDRVIKGSCDFMGRIP